MDVDSFLTELASRVDRAGGYVTQPSLGARLRVFICHASEDASIAKRVFDRLAAANCDPWLDTDALYGGDGWDEKIESALRETHYVVILHSAALVAKTDAYVNKEIRLAFERGERVRGSFVMPLLVDGLVAESQIDQFKTLQQLPLREATFTADVARVVKDDPRFPAERPLTAQALPQRPGWKRGRYPVRSLSS